MDFKSSFWLIMVSLGSIENLGPMRSMVMEFNGSFGLEMVAFGQYLKFHTEST